MRTTAALRILTLVLASAAAAHAGIYIESIEKNTRTGKSGETERFWAQGGNARIEGGNNISLLRGETLTVVNLKEKSYVVLDRASLEKMGAQMSSAKAEMDAQLAGLPPEQRAMVERMMGGGMPGGAGGAAPPIAVVDTGRNETIGERRCRLWNATRGETITMQHCVVPFDTLPGEEDVRAVVERIASLTEAIRESLPQMQATVGDTTQGMNGYPVVTRYYEAGKPTGRERHVTTWRAESVGADKFEVPKGFKRSEIPGTQP